MHLALYLPTNYVTDEPLTHIDAGLWTDAVMYVLFVASSCCSGPLADPWSFAAYTDTYLVQRDIRSGYYSTFSCPSSLNSNPPPSIDKPSSGGTRVCSCPNVDLRTTKLHQIIYQQQATLWTSQLFYSGAHRCYVKVLLRVVHIPTYMCDVAFLVAGHDLSSPFSN